MVNLKYKMQVMDISGSKLFGRSTCLHVISGCWPRYCFHTFCILPAWIAWAMRFFKCIFLNEWKGFFFWTRQHFLLNIALNHVWITVWLNNQNVKHGRVQFVPYHCCCCILDDWILILIQLAHLHVSMIRRVSHACFCDTCVGQLN